MKRSIIPEPVSPTTIERMREGLLNWKVLRGAGDFSVVTHHERGRCILAERDFKPGEFMMEYEGEFVSREQSDINEVMYSEEGIGCFIVDAFWNGKPVSIDGSLKLDAVGRLVNHARNGNIKPFRLLQLEPGKPPRLGFFSSRVIKRGQELFWDYGLKPGDTPWAKYRVPNPRYSPLPDKEEDTEGDSDPDIFSVLPSQAKPKKPSRPLRQGEE